MIVVDLGTDLVLFYRHFREAGHCHLGDSGVQVHICSSPHPTLH